MKPADTLKVSLSPEELPIAAHRQELLAALAAGQVLIVAGDTGSGKTTQLPKYCLEAGRGAGGRKIACTQPRRIAAISVAERVAEELGPSGGLVGYKIRFRDQTGPSTRIKFMTDGILLAEAQSDRLLAAYDTIIIDEAHERSLNIDFLLGLLKQLLPRRPDLKVIITSATIDTAKFAASFGQAPVIQVEGRTYPVEVRYQPLDPEQEEEGESSYVDQAVAVVAALHREEKAGDILVFMPTERDILETVESLAAQLPKGGRGGAPEILPLFGRLSPGDQKKIFLPARGRKIVVATNVAETSITVPGIRYVVDTGLARIASYNARARTSKLPIVPVSRASCDQRKGRCGRVGPGICVRLYSEEDYQNRPEFTLPEIQRANLAEVILRMTALRLGEPEKFPFVDPPSGRAIRDGYALLAELGALDRQRRLTPPGRLMARLPLDPRISRMIIEARDNNALREVVVIASALSIQDPRLRPPEKEAEADAAHARFRTVPSDFFFFLELWDAYHATLDKIKSLGRMRKFCKSHYLSFLRMREWRDIHEQIGQLLAEERGFAPNTTPASPEAVHRSILAGNLRNIAMRKEKNLYLGAGGREVMVFPGSCLFGKAGAWIMAAELVETSRLYARTVASIEPEWIEPLARESCRSSYSEPHWEKRRGQVVAYEKVTLFGLVIVARRSVNYGTIRPEEARQIFIQAALVEGELKGEYAFLKENQRLVAGLAELEDRLRQRDILVDDSALASFYETRLGPEVRDQRSLDRWLKEPGARARLVMREEDIRHELPRNGELERFPTVLEVGDFSLPLSYRFAPGDEEDGVSVQIPSAVLPHLRPERFEWLVPGLLVEKVIFLLKGLPKASRRLLVPVPQTAAQLVADLRFQHGSLYRALEQILADSFRLRIPHRDWPIGELPAHLKFRFCLLDAEGKLLKATRDFAELRAELPRAGALSAPGLGALRKCWEQEGIGAAALEAAPASLPVTGADGSLRGYVYPGLAAGPDGEVSRRLFASEEEARAQTRQSLLLLYAAEFPKQFKSLRRELELPRAHWALLEGLAGQAEFNGALFDAVFSEIFALRTGLIPSAEEFAARVAEVRGKGLALQARELVATVLALLEERRATLDAIARFAGGGEKNPVQSARFAGYRQEVDRIVPEDFLTRMPRGRYPALCRYLKALRIRVERAHAAPAKEAARARQVAVQEERYARAAAGHPSPELAALLTEYREMIEEFKVSLFAQELGTAYPISEKRLESKWQELELLCGA